MAVDHISVPEAEDPEQTLGRAWSSVTRGACAWAPCLEKELEGQAASLGDLVPSDPLWPYAEQVPSAASRPFLNSANLLQSWPLYWVCGLLQECRLQGQQNSSFFSVWV
jgi:hypothetical protein